MQAAPAVPVMSPKADVSVADSLFSELRVFSNRLRRPEVVFTEMAERADIAREEDNFRNPYSEWFRRGMERACVARHASHMIRELMPKAEEALESGLRTFVRLEFPRRNLHGLDWLRPGIIKEENVHEHGQQRAFCVYSLGSLMPALSSFFLERSVRVGWRIENSCQVRLHSGSVRQLGKYPVRVHVSLEGVPSSTLRRPHPLLSILFLALRRTGGKPPPLPQSGLGSRRASKRIAGSSQSTPPSECGSNHMRHTELVTTPMQSSAVLYAAEASSLADEGSEAGESVVFPADLARQIAAWVPHPDECALQSLFDYLNCLRDDMHTPEDDVYLDYLSE